MTTPAQRYEVSTEYNLRPKSADLGLLRQNMQQPMTSSPNNVHNIINMQAKVRGRSRLCTIMGKLNYSQLNSHQYFLSESQVTSEKNLRFVNMTD